MTEREISWRLERISEDYDNQLRIKAKLHGMEYKAPQKNTELAVKLKPEDEEKISLALEKAKARKRAEYGNRS